MQKYLEKSEIKREFKKRIYHYVIRLVKFTKQLPMNPASSEIAKQLIRSGSSVGANYFEAQGASSKKDFKNYFSHSLKSANESKFWLGILADGDMLLDSAILEHQWLLQETKELANIFASSIITMTGRR